MGILTTLPPTSKLETRNSKLETSISPETLSEYTAPTPSLLSWTAYP